MKPEDFLFKDKVEQITADFSHQGWVTIYERKFAPNDSTLVYSLLVKSRALKSYLLDNDWGATPGSEGKPSIFSKKIRGKWVNSYETFADKEFEPFLFSKHFSFDDGHDEYVDISEEFIQYFKLYEKLIDKQNRQYFFIDDSGDLEEVIKVTTGKIIVKKKYLMEYISIRKIHFSICYDFERALEGTFSDHQLEPLDNDFVTSNSNYHHGIRSLGFANIDKIQSWIHGKSVIKYDPKKSGSSHFDLENYKYESFITGYDNDGNEVYQSCKKENSKLFTLTYFKKEVLNKYYNNPDKYEVDTASIKSKFFYLKIDNNIENYVPVFLTELGSLPYKEQLYWKHYNIGPQNGISPSYYKSMIKGEWPDQADTIDLLFKERYIAFNKKWEAKFGWSLYKQLNEKDEHYFKSLHLPTENNIKTFCEQILSIVKLTIDRLNEKELSRNIKLVGNEKGLSKLEKFLDSKKIRMPDMLSFLRNLQDLRSGLIAHSFSNSNKACNDAMKYFGFEKNSMIEIAKEIFIKSIYTLNTLEKVFLK